MNEFVKLTSANHWFEKHPEKIAGKEYASTSIYFPLMVKGTKEDVLRVIGTLKKQHNKIKTIQLKAKALRLRLKLSL